MNQKAEHISNKIIEILRREPAASLIIKGHTDNAGNPESNILLSEKRARIVQDYFVQKGIDANRIKTIALGDSEPIASNENVQGRRMNRRVEIEILH